jgi:hypothetical protein
MKHHPKQPLLTELAHIQQGYTMELVERLYHARLDARDINPELARLLSEAREEIISLVADLQILMGGCLPDEE